MNGFVGILKHIKLKRFVIDQNKGIKSINQSENISSDFTFISGEMKKY